MTIDDTIKDMDDLYQRFKEEERHKKVKEAFEAVDAFLGDENQNNLYNNILTPAFDELYKTLESGLKSELGKDATKLYGKKDKIKKVMIEALKKFFEKAMPSVLKGIEGETDSEAVYKILSHHYGEVTGAEGIIDKLVEDYSADKKKTVGHLKRHFKSSEDDYKALILNKLAGTYSTVHLGHFNKPDVAHYVRELAEKKNFEIDRGDLYTLGIGDLHQAHVGINKGKWGIDKDTKQPKNPKDYGLKPK